MKFKKKMFSRLANCKRGSGNVKTSEKGRKTVEKSCLKRYISLVKTLVGHLGSVAAVVPPVPSLVLRR